MDPGIESPKASPVSQGRKWGVKKEGFILHIAPFLRGDPPPVIHLPCGSKEKPTLPGVLPGTAEGEGVPDWPLLVQPAETTGTSVSSATK